MLINLVTVCVLLLSALTAVATFVAACAAGYSAWQARKATEELRNTRFDEFLPVIVRGDGCSADADSFTFSVKNQGKGVAFDMRLQTFSQPQISKTTLNPGDTSDIKFVGGHEILQEDGNFIELIFDYRDMFGREIQTIFPLSRQKLPAPRGARKFDIEVSPNYTLKVK